MRKLIGLVQTVLAVLLSGLAASARVHTNTAVAFQSDPAHTGIATLDEELTLPLKRKWSVDLGGPVSYPIIHKGLVFVTVGNPAGEGQSEVIALSLKSGQQIWERTIYDPLWNHTNAAYDNGRLFVTTMSGAMEAITADSAGQVLWATQMQGPQDIFASPPTAYHGKFYIEGQGRGQGAGVTIYAVNEATGDVVWTQTAAAGGDGSPALGGGGVYMVYPQQYYRLDANTGDVVWHDDLGGDGGGGRTPVLYNHRVYGLEVEKAGLNPVLNARDGTERALIHASMTSPVLFQNARGQTMMVQVGYDYILYCMNPKNGRVKWTFSAPKWDGFISAPLLVNGLIFEGDEWGFLYVLDPESGKLLWTESVGHLIRQPNELNFNGPLPGFAAAENTILIPATNSLVAYRPKRAVP